MIAKVPAKELAAEREAARALRERWGGKAYHIVTYGCQMNAHESETLAGILQEMGMEPASTRWDADLLLFNTCCIRENAEKRLFGNIGKLRKHKEEQRPGMMIGVCGCMMQQNAVADALMKRYPFVDFVIGTQGTYALPSVIQSAMQRRVNAVTEDERLAEGQPMRRADAYRAYLSIMYGCDNYCSYCVVPYVRGRERSRDAADVIAQAETLAADGVREITLLGQNVNSYAGGMDFASLLRKLDGVVPRIRFMTSHPKDLSHDVIEAMALSRSVARHLHLPVQSGSDDVLRAMNRRYDRAKYLGILAAAREAMPDLGVTTDFIVGFPGESEEDFQETLDLVKTARFDAAFTFAFSPRKGTRAAQMEGQLPDAVKDERLQRLIALQEEMQQAIYQGLVGSAHEILVEGPSKRGEGVTGRIGRGITVNVKGIQDAGTLKAVTIAQAKHKTLYAKWGAPII